MSDEIIIIGSGISAAGACYHLRENGLKAAVYDKNSFPWGHTATHVYEPGYLFDEGPHVSFTSDERIQEIFAESLGGEFDSTPYVLNNYWQGYWATHPVQNHLKGLPPEIVTTIIAEFARLSSDDVEINNYADWLNASYGPTFAKNFPMVYTEKYHTTQAENLTTDWIGPRMHQPDLEQVILGAISENPPNIHYIKNFRYPKSGGFEQYLPSFFKGFDIALNHEVVEISPAEKHCARRLRAMLTAVAGASHQGRACRGGGSGQEARMVRLCTRQYRCGACRLDRRAYQLRVRRRYRVLAFEFPA